MFNFFKKEDSEINSENDNIVPEELTSAAITYFIDQDGKVKIDISLADYENNTIDDLCEILNVLCQERCYIETVDMIKNGLIDQDKQEALVRLIMQLGKQASYGLLKAIDESKNQPCIRPSDMLK